MGSLCPKRLHHVSFNRVSQLHLRKQETVLCRILHLNPDPNLSSVPINLKEVTCSQSHRLSHCHHRWCQGVAIKWSLQEHQKHRVIRRVFVNSQQLNIVRRKRGKTFWIWFVVRHHQVERSIKRKSISFHPDNRSKHGQRELNLNKQRVDVPDWYHWSTQVSGYKVLPRGPACDYRFCGEVSVVKCTYFLKSSYPKYTCWILQECLAVWRMWICPQRGNW